MSVQMKDLVAELLNQGYAFDDIKNEIDAQVKAREEEAKRVQEEAMAAQFQAQKIADADQLVANVITFLNTYYPDCLADTEIDSVTGIGELLVKELDSSMNMLKFMAKMYTPKTVAKKPTAEVKKAKSPALDPITVFLQEFGL